VHSTSVDCTLKIFRRAAQARPKKTPLWRRPSAPPRPHGWGAPSETLHIDVFSLAEHFYFAACDYRPPQPLPSTRYSILARITSPHLLLDSCVPDQRSCTACMRLLTPTPHASPCCGEITRLRFLQSASRLPSCHKGSTHDSPDLSLISENGQ
jgi:hypothetical protein